MNEAAGRQRAAGVSQSAPAATLTVRELRQANGWTQARLAHEAGVSTRTIHGIECGSVRSPRVTTRKKLCQALQVAWCDQVLLFGPLRRVP